MKSKIITTAFMILFFSLNLSAQMRIKKENRDKIKSLKIAYITEQLDLTVKEAEKFWPVYNSHEDVLHKLRMEEGSSLRKTIKEKGGLKALSEKDAASMLSKLMKIEQEVFKANQAFRKKLMKFLPNKKILKLEYAERGFKKEMFNRLRKFRKPRERN